MTEGDNEPVGYRYQILGTTRVHHEDGTSVPLGGARLRALLTALALTPGQDVRADSLIAAVWADGEPPADAHGALQALVGRLRRSLDHATIASAESGYRLVAEAQHVDACRFEQLAESGVRALLGGDATKAVELLEDALRLWRGAAYADLPDGGGAAAVRAEARRLEAARTLAEARIALGEPAAVLADLAVLCTEHPLDEPLQALRLRALRDAGRPAEALAAYEAVRTELAELLGADPGPELRALHAQLLTQATPPFPPDTEQSAAALPLSERPPCAATGNLPTRLTSFVGREEELEAIQEELASFRLVTLLGPGGAGKTRLSLEAAEKLAAQWPDGVWLAELAPVMDAATVPETVLTALGGRESASRAADGLRTVADTPPPDPLAELAELCTGRRMLLVLDNCEHVIDAAARLAEQLLVKCPGVTVLATSREPLGVTGESVLVVDPLPPRMALRLLEERGAASRTGFKAAHDPEAAEEICRRLDGLPLAIELAAARLRSLTPRQLADRLDDRFRLLSSGSRTALPRQQTLRAVVDWSWELLDGAERSVLQRLSVCAGGVELEQAEAICQGPGVDARDVAILLSSLVDKSLLVPATSAEGGGMRYRLLETVAEYAAERLTESGERADVERRHLVCYRELARTLQDALRGADQVRQLDRLEREHDNIRAALRRAQLAGDEQEALSLTLSMGWFWQLRNHRRDARYWCQATAALGPDPFASQEPAPDVAERCTDVPPPLAEPLLWEARRQVRMLGLVMSDPAELEGEASARLVRSVIDTYRPDQPQLCHTVCPFWYFARVLAGEVEDLRADLDRTVAGCRKLGYDWELASVLRLRSRLRGGKREHLAKAVADADESLALFSALGDGWGVAEALSSRAEIREAEGDLAGAIEDLREGIRIAGETKDQDQAQLFRARLGSLLVEAGQDREGEKLLRRTLAEGDRLGSDTLTLTRIYLATHLGRTGRVAECRTHLDILLTEFVGRQEQQRLLRGMVEALYGWMELLDGRPQEARVSLLRAAERSQYPLGRLLAPELASVSLLHGAEAAVALGRAEDAAKLLGAFDVLHGQAAPRLSLLHQDCRSRAERDTRAVLGDEGYEAAYRAGVILSPAEATRLI